jgi:MoaA/NifB/PqqE/SkfB family radical SAM enzyme
VSVETLARYSYRRARSKGMLNLASAVSRTYFGGVGSTALANAAWLRERAAKRLPRFSVVQIETMSGCNYSCSFCPIGKVKLPSGRMSAELYERIIDQLSDFNGAIHPFLSNEPLLDKRIAEFCRLAAERTKASVLLQTNGSRLTEELTALLTQYATVVVNDYTRDKAVLRRVSSYGIRRNLILLDRSPDEILTNRAGNVPGRPIVQLRSFCVRPFSQLYIAHNGLVVLCCQDWQHEEVMGDATCQTLDEIWNGERYRRVRANLLNRDRRGLCSKCDFPGV